MNPHFWRNRTVFLTGHTGFKGSWLSLWLQKHGARVIGYALPPPTNPSLYDLARVDAGMDSIIGDVRDLASLRNAMVDAAPDVVIHMAAQPLVLYSYEHPVETYATNVMGTVHLLEAVRSCPSVRVAVVVTTDKCYENKEWVWGYRENEPMGGFDPYSNSKGCAELVTSAYRNSFFSPERYSEHRVAVASVRAGNVIGGGDWAANRLIPDMMKAIIAGESVVIRSPRAIRPWQHVLEPLNGYLMLAERLWDGAPEYMDGWNFGPNETDVRDVEWIVDRIVRAWGKGARWTLDSKVHPHEANYLKLDCSKAKARLGWSPKTDVNLALDWIVEWFKVFQQQEDVREITQSQIERFENLAT